MDKKLLAVTIALLMVLSTASVINHPAKAATPEGVKVFLRPGVEDADHPGWSQTLGTLYNNPQEVINKYLDYAILASTEGSPSIGDLQFDFAIDSTFSGMIWLYIPPEFVFMKPDGTETTEDSEKVFNVWTDITNDYNFIQVSTRNIHDTYAPEWTRITIGESRVFPDDDPAWYEGITLDPGTYHVRIFNLKAPMEAGVYHFKIGMGPWLEVARAPNFDVNDYPIIIVKNELNPAYVTGEVVVCSDPHAHPQSEQCLAFDAERYGKVWLEGTTPEGRSVSARYYFSPADFEGFSYKFWLFGVAPGTYTIKASAGGYPTTNGERLDVLMGQSLHLKKGLWLFQGPHVDFTVWSKHGRGAIPWASLWQPPYGTNDPSVLDLDKPRPILVDLYDSEGKLLAETCGVPPGTYAGTVRPGCADYTVEPAVLKQATYPTDPLADNYVNVIGPEIEYTANVPSDKPKFINGFVAGQEYNLQAFVTGYVMTEDDAWQRKFKVSGNIHVEMDLRRSNWFAVKVGMGFDPPFPTVPTTLALTATDSAGTERGANSLLVGGTVIGSCEGVQGWLSGLCTGPGSAGDLIFWQDGYATFGPIVNPNTGLNYNLATDPIILEGYSYRYLYSSGSTDDESLDNPGFRDYGFMPGTYEIGLRMADMGDPTGVIYSGTVPVEERTFIEGVGWYTIREGQPNKGSIALCNAPSSIQFDTRSNSLTVTLRSVDWQAPAHVKPWTFPGAEITFTIFSGTGEEFIEHAHIGDTETETIDVSIYGIVQDDGTIGTSYALKDDLYDAVTGLRSDPRCTITTDTFDYDACLTVKYTGLDYWWAWSYGPDTALDSVYSTSIPPGQYDYEVHTFGYTTRGARSGYGNILTLGGDADIQVDMIQGGQIRVISSAWKTLYTAGVPFNGWVRVEVYNANDELVGASVYGMADPNPLAIADGLLAYAPWDPTLDFKVVNSEPAEGAGNDAAPEFGFGQRAYTSLYFWGKPSVTFANYINTNPIDANRLEVPAFQDFAFDVYGFNHYHGGPSSRNQGLWANGWDTTDGVMPHDHGLRGSKDFPGVTGGGLYTVKIWAFDPRGPDNEIGTADDWQSYYQIEEFTGVEVPWGGVVTVHPTIQQYGRLVGDARWDDQFGNARLMPWLQVSASGETTVVAYSAPMVGSGAADSEICFGVSGFGGAAAGDVCEPSFFAWVPDGTYDVSAQVTVAPQVLSAPGAPFVVEITHGFATSLDIDTEQTGVPVPEFTLAPLVALSALAASVYVLRRRRK